MSNTNTNLDFWNSVQETNPKYTKNYKKGGDRTTVNATYQIKNATEKWGMLGGEWGLKDISFEYMDISDTKLAIIKAFFYHPNGGFEIHSCIKVAYMKKNKKTDKLELYVDDEFAKKIETDVLTKALSKVGFNADIYMGRYDDNRYVNTMDDKYNPKPKPVLKADGLDFLVTKGTKDQISKALKERTVTDAQRKVLEGKLKEIA